MAATAVPIAMAVVILVVLSASGGYNHARKDRNIHGPLLSGEDHSCHDHCQRYVNGAAVSSSAAIIPTIATTVVTMIILDASGNAIAIEIAFAITVPLLLLLPVLPWLCCQYRYRH